MLAPNPTPLASPPVAFVPTLPIHLPLPNLLKEMVDRLFLTLCFSELGDLNIALLEVLDEVGSFDVVGVVVAPSYFSDCAEVDVCRPFLSVSRAGPCF